MSRKNEKGKVIEMSHQKKESIILTHAQIEGILNSPAIVGTIRKTLQLKQAYWLARAIDKMRGIYKVYKEEQQEVVNLHAEKDKNGRTASDDKGMVKWIEGHEEAAGRKLKELAEIEVDLGINRISLDFDRPEAAFTTEDLLILLPLINEPA